MMKKSIFLVLKLDFGRSVLYFIFSVTFVVVSLCFPATIFGQIAMPLSDIFHDIKGRVVEIKSLDSRLFIGTDSGLWLLAGGGQPIKQTEIIGGVINIRKFSNQIFIITYAGIWRAQEYGGIVNVEGISRIINDSVLDDRLFVGTDEGLRVIGKNGKSSFPAVRGQINHVETFGEQIFVNTDRGSWIIRNDNQTIQIDEIQTKVVKVMSFGNRLFVNTERREGLIIDRDGTAVTINEPIDSETTLISFNEQLFISKDKGSWRIDQDGGPARAEEIQEKISSSGTLGDELFVNSGENLLKIDENGVFSRINEIEGRISYIGTVDERLFITAENIQGKSLWVIDKDHQKTHIAEINERVNSIHSVFGQFFVNTESGLWLLSGDYRPLQIKGGVARVTVLSILEGRLLVGTEKGFWIIDKDGQHSKKIESIAGHVKSIAVVGNSVYVSTSDAFVEAFYRVDPEVEVVTGLNPDWNTNIIGFLFSLLVSNALPAEKIPVTASYSDVNGRDPYSEEVPKEFRFAIANGDELVSDRKFSNQEQFGFPVNLGTNEVRYLVKDKWGNAFDYRKQHFGFPGTLLVGIIIAVLILLGVLGCFFSAPVIEVCNSLIMRSWVRNFLSIGVIPILLHVSYARNHILRRYSTALHNDVEFKTLLNYDYPNEKFEPEKFREKLESDRQLLLCGQSSAESKALFLKHLTAYFAFRSKAFLSEPSFPVYISLTDYNGSHSFEGLIYEQLAYFGKISGEFAPIFLERGKLIIFFDGIDDIKTDAERKRFIRFLANFGKGNLICFSAPTSKGFEWFESMEI